MRMHYYVFLSDESFLFLNTTDCLQCFKTVNYYLQAYNTYTAPALDGTPKLVLVSVIITYAYIIKEV